MSSISETTAQRMTLGMLAQQYQFDMVPSFAHDVTVTSLANDAESVTPGALFIPGQRIDKGRIALAVQRGAYAMVLPTSMRNVIDDQQIPILFGDPTVQQIGQMAAHIAGMPSDSIAMFALAGPKDRLREDVSVLAQFLHMLGNPVGTICAGEDQSLEHFLDVSYPIDAFAMQRVLSVCVEDGVTAMIIALDDETLGTGALSSVRMDVIGIDASRHSNDIQAMIDQACAMYGCVIDDDTHIALRTDESDVMAIQAELDHVPSRALSLAVSMVLAAGIRKSNIRSALRVSKELH